MIQSSEGSPRRAKDLLRQSGKRIDQMLSSSDEFISAPVTKEGILMLQGKSKWKIVHFALCGGILYWKQKETSITVKGEIPLNGAKIEKTTLTQKNIFSFMICVNDTTYNLASEKESVTDEWIREIQENVDKPPTSLQNMRKDTRVLRAQKRIGGSIATSAAGKKIIREALGEEGYKGITIIKKVIVQVDGKKKAKEVEETLIRTGVKLILLAKNKDLTMEDLLSHRASIKEVCDAMSIYAQFAYEYTPAAAQNQMDILKNDIQKTLQRCFSPKNFASVMELYSYISSTPILAALFTDPSLKEWKTEWHYLMKNISSKLDFLE